MELWMRQIGRMELTDDVMNQVLRDVSKNISKERKKRGLSMAKLAEMSNLSVSHISKLERSRCDIGLKALLRIAAAMEMEADELLPGDFEPKETERKLTAGERFEQIMQGADPQLVEMFLRMALYMRNNSLHNFS